MFRALTNREADHAPGLSYVRLPPENWLWGLLLFGILVLLVPLWFLTRIDQPNLAAPTSVTFVGVAYSGLRLSLLALEGRKKLLSLTFWIFAYIWMSLCPMLQLASESFPWPGAYSQRTLIYAGVVVLLGYVSFDVGCWLVGRRRLGSSSPVSLEGLVLSKKRIYVLSLLAILIAALVIVKLGGLQAMFVARTTFGEEIYSGSKTAGLIWNTLLRTPPFIALLMCWWVWLKRKDFWVQGLERMGLYSLLLALICLNAVVNNPIKTPRFFIGTIGLSLLFMTLRWNRKRSFGLWVIAILSMLLLAFPYMDYFRREYRTVVLQPVLTQLASNADYDAFQALLNTLQYVAAQEITVGWQMLGVLLFWVPRSLWSSKPLGSGELVAEYSGYDFTNIPSPLWAEAYINGGVIAVVLVFLAYGILTSILQGMYLDPQRSPISVVGILVPLLAAYQMFLLRGELISTFGYLVPMIAYLTLAVSWKHPLGKRAKGLKREHRKVVSLSLVSNRRR